MRGEVRGESTVGLLSGVPSSPSSAEFRELTQQTSIPPGHPPGPSPTFLPRWGDGRQPLRVVDVSEEAAKMSL